MTQQTVGANAGTEPQETFQQEHSQQEMIPAGPKLPESLEEVVARSIELRRENRDLKAKMDANAAELKRMDPIIEQFAKRQTKSQKRTTGETIYVEKSVYASLVKDGNGEHEEAHRALQEHGLEWLVKDKVDSQSLNAWVREQQQLETEIPEGLLPFLNISEVYRVKVRL